MQSCEDRVAEATRQYHLSNRGAYNSVYRDVWGPRETSMGNSWLPTNPDGIVLLRLAENSLMHDEIAGFIRKQLNVIPADHLTYSIGPRGSLRLRAALATYFNDYFHTSTAATADDFCITPGLTSCIDSVAWAICDPGEAILIPKPYYNGFTVDITHRSGAQLVGVDYDDMPGYTCLDDLFRPDINREALEAALSKAKASGIRVRALIISQPHNPLGRCYPPDTLREFLLFCRRHQLHLISDEIYANSVFQNHAMCDPTPFTSILTMNGDRSDDPLLHVMYGASKDFCANGLRLGSLYTKNKGVIRAISSNGQFAWSPHVLQDVWAAMLEDRDWLQKFFAQNHELMARNHAIATSFLGSNNIQYFDSNAGVFIWIDFRRYLLPRSLQNGEDYRSLRTTSPDSASLYLERESRLAAVCVEHGVMISPGSIYASKEFGWFRITFTLAEPALREGLCRLEKALKSVEDDFRLLSA